METPNPVILSLSKDAAWLLGRWAAGGLLGCWAAWFDKLTMTGLGEEGTKVCDASM